MPTSVQTIQILLIRESLDSVPASLLAQSRSLKIIQRHMAAEDRWVMWPHPMRLRGAPAVAAWCGPKEMKLEHPGSEGTGADVSSHYAELKLMRQAWFCSCVPPVFRSKLQGWLCLSKSSTFAVSLVTWTQILRDRRDVKSRPLLRFPFPAIAGVELHDISVTLDLQHKRFLAQAFAFTFFFLLQLFFQEMIQAGQRLTSLMACV